MKNKILFFITALVIIGIQNAQAQVWSGIGPTSAFTDRSGDVTIGGGGNRGYKLHVHTSTANEHVLISGNSPSIRFNEGGSGIWTEQRGNLGLATANGHYFPGSVPNDFILRASTTNGSGIPTGNLLFGLGNSTSAVERMRIDANGNIGIGPLFGRNPSNGVITNPSRLLHIKSGTSAASIFIDATTVSNVSTPKLEFGSDGTSSYEIYNSKYPACGGGENGQFKIGPVDPAKKSIYLISQNSVGHTGGRIIFSNSSSFGYGSCISTTSPGLSGTYLFDDQVSSTSLLVAPATSTLPYTTIPGGYLFRANGNSNVDGNLLIGVASGGVATTYKLDVQGSTLHDGIIQLNNTSDLDPSKSVAGLSLGNNITNTSSTVFPYSWIQSGNDRPLALNPDQDANPSVRNYVTIGFVPGVHTVPNNYKLAVKGKIICEELKVKYAGLWSDYVFDKEYKLKELDEVEKYISENKHLPDVPSETEIKENGFETGQMDATLLRKIEELTLYVIEQNKRIKELEGQSKNRKKRK